MVSLFFHGGRRQGKTGEMRWQKIRGAGKAGTIDPKDGAWGGVDGGGETSFAK